MGRWKGWKGKVGKVGKERGRLERKGEGCKRKVG